MFNRSKFDDDNYTKRSSMNEKRKLSNSSGSQLLILGMKKKKEIEAKIDVAQLKEINIDIWYVIMIRSNLHPPNRLMNKL